MGSNHDAGRTHTEEHLAELGHCFGDAVHILLGDRVSNRWSAQGRRAHSTHAIFAADPRIPGCHVGVVAEELL